MDASINISMEPFRAFVGDMLPEEQRTTGFAMQSFFIGAGSVIASALPYMLTNWFGVSNEPGKSLIPDSVRWSFYAGGIVFILSVLWTIIRTREYSPEEMRSFNDQPGRKNSGKVADEVPAERNRTFIRNGLIWMIAGIALSAVIYWFSLKAELYILTVGIGGFGLLQIITGLLVGSGKRKNGFVVVINDLYNMPKTMAQLAVVQFFTWFALFAMFIYSTSAVTSHIFGTNDTTSELYNKGANWVGVLFSVYNGFAALVAFLLPVIARKTNRRITHMISLIAGGLGLISIYFVSNPNMLILSMLGVGLAWASILSMPYAILTGSLPAEKMGTYMGIFNFFIVIPQIMAASLLGFFAQAVFGGKAIYTLMLGGVSMILAAILVLFVYDPSEKLVNKKM
jgi:maltose/moltooligosaccharide transporter